MQISDLKQALSHLASGVSIVTYSNEKEKGGITVTSFTSLSIEPPLVLVCIHQKATSHDKIVNAKHFAINLLDRDQEDLSNQFATPTVDKNALIEKIGFLNQNSSAPLLKNCLANIECELVNHFPGGDHSIFIGKPVSVFSDNSKKPLLYYGRKYYGI